MTRLHPLLIPDWRERLADNARTLGLTPRQTEVSLLMVEGLTYPQIAERLCLSEASIKKPRLPDAGPAVPACVAGPARHEGRSPRDCRSAAGAAWRRRMTAGDFVRVTSPAYQGCTGVIVAAVDGGYDVRMTATGLVRWFGEDELRREKRTSEIQAEALRAAARERIQSGVPVRGIRERLKGAAA